MTIGWLSRVCLLFLLLASAAGCAFFDSEPKGIEGDHPTLLVGVDSGEFMDALQTGLLTDAGGCYGFVGDTRQAAVVIWPEGTTVGGSGDGFVVRPPDGEDLMLGDEVALCGGFVEVRPCK